MEIALFDERSGGMVVPPEGGVHGLEGSFGEGIGIGCGIEDGEDGGTGAGHHGGERFVLVLKVGSEGGEEAVLFENGPFEVVEKLLTASFLGFVGNAGDFLGVFPA